MRLNRSELLTKGEWNLHNSLNACPSKSKIITDEENPLDKYLHDLLYSSKFIYSLIYLLKYWLIFLQFCVFFLIILVFHFANQMKVCRHQSVTSLSVPRQHVVPWETIAYRQESLKLLNSSFNIVKTEAIKKKKVWHCLQYVILSVLCPSVNSRWVFKQDAYFLQVFIILEYTKWY